RLMEYRRASGIERIDRTAVGIERGVARRELNDVELVVAAAEGLIAVLAAQDRAVDRRLHFDQRRPRAVDQHVVVDEAVEHVVELLEERVDLAALLVDPQQ